MVELFAVYALLLAGWGLWRVHRGAAASPSPEPADEPAAPSPPPADVHERGAATRRHLSTLP